MADFAVHKCNLSDTAISPLQYLENTATIESAPNPESGSSSSNSASGSIPGAKSPSVDLLIKVLREREKKPKSASSRNILKPTRRSQRQTSKGEQFSFANEVVKYSDSAKPQKLGKRSASKLQDNMDACYPLTAHPPSCPLHLHLHTKQLIHKRMFCHKR